MAERFVDLTVPEAMIKEPIIYTLGQQFDVVPNIFRADVTPTTGWTILQLEGEESEIERAIEWLQGHGITVKVGGEELLQARDEAEGS
ncbi:MAG: NIL domain-containing protein [bacterium]|jgi:ABC-type methionine transport system ATPase subunit